MVEITSINNQIPSLPFNKVTQNVINNVESTVQTVDEILVDFSNDISTGGVGGQEIVLPEKIEEELNENLREFIEKPESFQKLVEQLNELSKKMNYSLRFGVFGESQQFYVRVLDRNSQSLIKVIPMRELMELREKILQQKGILVDENA